MVKERIFVTLEQQCGQIHDQRKIPHPWKGSWRAKLGLRLPETRLGNLKVRTGAEGHSGGLHLNQGAHAAK